jgi:high-affinity nickel-transport protein
MCLVDTIDGALMMALYTSKAFSRDRIAILYYSIVLTAITVGVAAFIGAVQVLTLARTLVGPPDGDDGEGEHWFWDWVDSVGEHFDIIGACICAVFALVGIGSVLVYGPWRRAVERRGGRGRGNDGENGPDEQSGLLRRGAEQS